MGSESSLFDPNCRFTLGNYCAEHGIRYADLGRPVPLEVFSEYGMAFQKQLVPSLDTRRVTELKRRTNYFSLTLDDGQIATANRVVIATGISYFEYLPDELARLPPTACSHSAENQDLSRHKRRQVLVIGRGASATDIAALLSANSASVQIVSREPIVFNLPPGDKPRSLWKRMIEPNFGLARSFRSAIYTLFPGVFHFCPCGCAKESSGDIWVRRRSISSR